MLPCSQANEVAAINGVLWHQHKGILPNFGTQTVCQKTKHSLEIGQMTVTPALRGCPGTVPSSPSLLQYLS